MSALQSTSRIVPTSRPPAAEPPEDTSGASVTPPLAACEAGRAVLARAAASSEREPPQARARVRDGWRGGAG
eukprot:5944637-Prymnesium_polylepis.1